MANFKKKLALVSCMLVTVLSLTACGGKDTSIKYEDAAVTSRAQSVIKIYDMILSQGDAVGYSADDILGYDENHLEQFEQSQLGGQIKGSAFQSGLDSYKQALDSFGGSLSEVSEEADITSDESNITVDIDITGANGKQGEMEVIMTSTYKVTDIVFNVNKTFGEKIQNAALNTVLGMGTTFCVLILIALIIALLPVIVAPFNGTKKKAAAPAPAPTPAPAPAPAEVKEDLTDDKELIAVISAAIAAYESEATGVAVSPDTFVVRSLRRR